MTAGPTPPPPILNGDPPRIGFRRGPDTAGIEYLLQASARLAVRSRELQEHARVLSVRFERLNEECERRFGR